MRIVLAGLALGILSRVDERTAGLSGISTHAVWALAALAAGARTAARRRAAIAGAAVLTVANGGYYAWVRATEPGVPLASVAGSVEHWFALGVATGVVFGLAGALVRTARPRGRAALLLAVAAVLVADGLDAFRPLLP